MTCNNTIRTFTIMVVVPTDNSVIRFKTYGIPDIGDVPNAALMDSTTPIAIMHRPISKNKYRLQYSQTFAPIFPHPIKKL